MCVYKCLCMYMFCLFAIAKVLLRSQELTPFTLRHVLQRVYYSRKSFFRLFYFYFLFFFLFLYILINFVHLYFHSNGENWRKKLLNRWRSTSDRELSFALTSSQYLFFFHSSLKNSLFSSFCFLMLFLLLFVFFVVILPCRRIQFNRITIVHISGLL